MYEYIEANQPVSAYDIAKHVGITRTSVRQTKQGIYISEWVKGKRNVPMALYSLGDYPDAKRPPSMTQRKRSKLYRERKKKIILSRRPSMLYKSTGIWAALL